MDGERGATALGFAAAIVVLGIVFWIVGIDKTLQALRSASLPIALLVVPVAVCWLTMWGMALHTVLRALDAPVSAPTAVLVFASAMFANNVTPFGQAGGEPLSALLISESADTEYETGLAAIASVDALHFVPSIGLATLGLGYIAVQTVTLGRNLLLAAGAVAVLATAVPLAAFLGWRYRYELEAAVVRVLTPVIRGVGRLIPGREPVEPGVIERRIEGFFEAIDRVAASRRTIVLALGFSLAGWVSLAGALWVATYAVGVTVPFAAVMVVIPIGSIAGVTPLPGGLGGIEAAFAALLVATTGIPGSTAFAAVFIHRAATYWLSTITGGGVAAAIWTQRSRKRRANSE
ncbi:lysylphosphatidylglycerol synthase transmembrane domain-containing protein [Halorientalis pallida]|uniref:Flippase-like domain-containing protein n=1 Tax=Halorientalis pallida TaxID=2479928 RepID=A0A498KV38_9EURY|nr:lysylphosphatidylglycerol synthase transmembrane domain-containing protein [Halorientalis pallida]RXK47379.1 flippase-like domain-containing protein [Halorientalis pallida]